MTASRVVLITGATGKQGGALARALAGQPFQLRALTRRPASEPARALERRGVEVVGGDLDDPASLKGALHGVWGVFSVQDSWEAGVEREVTQGKRLAELARDAGVERFVYSSVGSADRRTGIPHFESKAHIEEAVRALHFPAHVILRPVYFMENLLAPGVLVGDAVVASLRPETVLQMVAVDDVGRVAARAFIDSQLAGRELEIAGDAVTMVEAAAALGEALRRHLGYRRVPIEEVRRKSEDLALMMEWFDRVGYSADISGLERELDLRMTRLAAWAHRHLRASA